MSFQKNCFFLIITCVLVFQASFAYGRSFIDLVSAKINDLPIFELTLDKVTDLFGKPSVVEPPCVIGERFGAFLHYHDEGLTFVFYHPETDKEQRCIGVYVYLAKKWNKGVNRFYTPYSGEIRRNVNARWKVKDVIKTFSDCNPRDLNDARIQITPPGSRHKVTFEYEGTTKFIEKIAVFLPIKKQ